MQFILTILIQMQKKANGTLIFECDKNDNLCSEAFAIYSNPIEDLDATETQDLFIYWCSEW